MTKDHLFGAPALALVGTALAAVFCAPAFAQDAAPQPVASANEIIVTARRTEENAQTVPVTIAAFNADTLRQSSIRETQDLMYAVPGVYLTGAGGKENAVYSIRGQGRPVAGPGQPGVVSYFAEVPLPNFGSSAMTYDLSSVQVLKGPQGTLFGRNTTGGAVLLYPTVPTYRLEGYVQGSYGNYDYKDLEGAVNLPIVQDKVAIRFSGRLSRRDGYTKNIGTGGNPDNVHSDQFRLALRVNPVEGIENVTYFDYRRTRSIGSSQVLVEVTPLAALFGIDGLLGPDLVAQQARGPRVVDYGVFVPRSNQKHSTIINRTEIDLGFATFINIFGHQRLEWLYDANTDALPEPIGLLDAYNLYHNRVLTDEVQVRGTALDDKLDWLMGGFYYKKDDYDTNGSIFPQFFGLFPGNFSYAYVTEHSRALFGNVSYHLDDMVDGLTLNAGLRHTWDKQTTCGGSGESSPPHTVGPDECSANNPIFLIGTGAKLTNRNRAFTWTIGADWKANDDLFLYATARKGYRAGGLNNPALGPTLVDRQVFKPEKVTDFEAGVKSSWTAGRLSGRANISVFLTKAKDVQYTLTGLVTQPGCAVGDPVFGGPPFSPDGDCFPGNDPAQSVLLVNIGDTTVRGVEFDLSISPIPALRLGLRGTLLDQSTDKMTLPAALATGYAGVTNGKVPLNFTAKKSLSADIRLELPVPDTLGKISLYSSLYWSDEVQLIAYRAPSYTLVDARLDWDDVGGTSLDASLFAKNLFDKDAIIAGAINTPGAPGISVNFNEPRMYGVQLRYRFGG
ncbi:TonB-dependent receptor [Novosphingobium sp. BL-52-GroH]|uniref:TonB-dependent receptor n=1 Tax=Novosphingobium sp. BL-52-GroH TaxID=3349877 RepID=UPI00384E522F